MSDEHPGFGAFNGPLRFCLVTYHMGSWRFGSVGPPAKPRRRQNAPSAASLCPSVTAAKRISAARLKDQGKVELTHRLESVKILPDFGANDPKLYGHITASAVSLREIQAPHRERAYCWRSLVPTHTLLDDLLLGRRVWTNWSMEKAKVRDSLLSPQATSRTLTPPMSKSTKMTARESKTQLRLGVF